MRWRFLALVAVWLAACDTGLPANEVDSRTDQQEDREDY